MRQALQLFTFLMTTGTSLKKFMSSEAIDQVADNLSRLNCQSYTGWDYGNGSSEAIARPTAQTLP